MVNVMVGVGDVVEDIHLEKLLEGAGDNFGP
jgi:hypothetical protein